jgi:hypothetical protein
MIFLWITMHFQSFSTFKTNRSKWYYSFESQTLQKGPFLSSNSNPKSLVANHGKGGGRARHHRPEDARRWREKWRQSTSRQRARPWPYVLCAVRARQQEGWRTAVEQQQQWCSSSSSSSAHGHGERRPRARERGRGRASERVEAHLEAARCPHYARRGHGHAARRWGRAALHDGHVAISTNTWWAMKWARWGANFCWFRSKFGHGQKWSLSTSACSTN